MSIKELKDGVHIYLGSDDKKAQVFSDNTSAHERFIILMNDQLQTENRELRKTNSDLEKQNSESSEEVDRLETGKRYANGLLKNISEVNKLYITLNTSLINNLTIDTDYFNKLNTYRSYYQYLFLVSGIITLIMYAFIDSYTAGFLLTPSIIVLNYAVFIMRSQINKQIITKTVSNTRTTEFHNTTKKEIERITKAQDYLGDLIDNI